MKRNILFLLAYLLCISCNAGDKFSEIYWKSNHLIDEYIEVRNARLDIYNPDIPSIRFQFKGDKTYPSQELYDEVMKWQLNGGDYYSSPSLVHSYYELAEKNGDFGFSNNYSYWVLGEDASCGILLDYEEILWKCNKALNKGVGKIEITSDKDFNNTYPAGSSLANIVNVDLTSYGSSLRNKKTEKIQITKLLSELTSNELAVIGYNIYFSFKSKPTLNKLHNLTVTITFDDGEVYSDTVEVKF
ncbi:MAG: hypothetical protein IKM12_01010 [Alistipes sp.]|nr:hypothetical protein [Alistipes sp.]